jgi:hypothetical protein
MKVWTCAGAEWEIACEPDEPPQLGHVNAHAPSVQRRSVQYASASGCSKTDLIGLAGTRGARDWVVVMYKDDVFDD